MYASIVAKIYLEQTKTAIEVFYQASTSTLNIRYMFRVQFRVNDFGPGGTYIRYTPLQMIWYLHRLGLRQKPLPSLLGWIESQIWIWNLNRHKTYELSTDYASVPNQDFKP